MIFKRHCLDCDKLYRPSGKCQKYCEKCQKLRRKEAKLKRRVANEKILYKKDLSMLRE